MLRSQNGIHRRRVSSAEYSTTIVAGTNDLIPMPKNGFKVVKMMDSSFPEGCFSSSHIMFAFFSFLVLILYSFWFPRTMHQAIYSIKPKPIAKDDPESPVFHAPKQGAANYPAKKKLYDELHGKPVIFNDEGQLVEYTDRIFLSEVKKHSDNPYTSLYKGYEQNWASYKIVVMCVKCFQLFLSVLATSDILGRDTLVFSQAQLLAAVGTVLSMSLFLGLSLKASPFVDSKNDKMEVVSKTTLIIVPLTVLLSAIGAFGGTLSFSLFLMDSSSSL